MKRLTLVPAIALAISALFLTTAGTASATGGHPPSPPSPASATTPSPSHFPGHFPKPHCSHYQGCFPGGFLHYYKKHHHKKKHHVGPAFFWPRPFSKFGTYRSFALS